MPRFFKRLFKFPQMDFEMAVWEMSSLIIAPKKVFRSIYYHKRMPRPIPTIPTIPLPLADLSPRFLHVTALTRPRNKEHLAPARPILHLPALLLPPPHSPRLGSSLRGRLLARLPDHRRLHLRPLPRLIPARRDRGLLPRRQTAGAWDCWVSGEEAAGAVRTAGERGAGAVGVWVLL